MAPPKKKTQASHKKAKSSPNQTAMRVVKAIRKTQSLNKVSSSCSSPTSVKKNPISENLKKKLSKKKKQVEDKKKQVDSKKNQEIPEGLKLLKRGCVTMHRILRRKIMNQKLTVTFNAKGEPCGDEAGEMQSYIGVLARTKVPIWHDSWKQVPEQTKNKIWDCVQMAFIVPPTARKLVWASACQKWREFKSRLTTYYILPHRNQPEKLIFPPADYTFIEKSHWDMFVADRLGEDFKKIHEDQVKRSQMNEYHHLMSRKGYANLEMEWLKKHPEEPIDRSDSWVLARKDKEGNFKNDKVKEKAENIELLKKKVKEGELVEEGRNDVLTMALGKPEHGGRVRGQGSHVRQSIYFDLPRQKKSRTIEERIREGVKNYLAEETPKIIKQRDAFWSAAIEKIRAELKMAKGVGQKGSPVIDSQQGSCSDLKGVPQFVNENDRNDVVRKKLNVESGDEGSDHGDKENVEFFSKENVGYEKIDEENEQNVFLKGEEAFMVDVDNEFVETEIHPKALKLDGLSDVCQLAIGSVSNIVAYGRVDEIAVAEGCEATLHGMRLSKENARVSISYAIQEDAKIPFPVGDEIVTVKQAVGSFIAWPRDLVVGNTSSTPVVSTPKNVKKRGAKKVGSKKAKKPVVIETDDVEDELNVEMGVNYPSSLKRLWMWAKDALSDGRTVNFQLNEQAFAATKKQVIFLQDIHSVCARGEMSGSVITIFIHFLYEFVKKNKMTNLIAFVDPGMVGAIGCGNAGERSRALANRFMNAKEGQCFLIPFNDVNHWSLTVVVPTTEVVYHMDPLKRRIASDEWVEVVDNSIKMYKERLNKVARKKIFWENMAGVPLQTGVRDCGLFVMGYMKEICYDKELQFANKWIRRGNLAYNEDDLNVIKMDFAKFFMKFYSC